MTSSVSQLDQLSLPLDSTAGRICRRCGLFKSLDDLMPHPDCLYGREKLCRLCFNAANYRRRGYTGTPKKYPLEQSANPVCRTCGIAKPLDQYQKRRDRRGGRIGDCNECRSRKRREHGEGRRRTPQARVANQHYRLRTRYGLTAEQLAGLHAGQDGRCAICGRELLPPPSKNTQVDHDHARGLVRGLLCFNCNMGLGYFKDNPTYLAAAAAYLSSALDRIQQEVE